MKKLKKYIVENYEGKYTFSELMSEGIPKLFLKIEAVKKEIARLEAERKKAVLPYKNEKDESKREKILNVLKDLTKKIKAGTDQTIVNFLVKKYNYVKKNIDIWRVRRIDLAW